MLLKYLLSFDESELPSIPEELDISDRSILEKQINETRQATLKLIRIQDDFRGDRLDISEKMSAIKREINLQNPKRNDRLDAIENNDEYQILSAKKEALDIALGTIGMQIDFLKSDLRILTNAMYNRN